MDEDRRLHLQMIQGVVSRLASNSFAVRGWSVVLTAGLFALSGKDTPILLKFVWVPVVVFWVLDSYYLWQERAFRDLYARAVEGDLGFSMAVKTSLKEWVSAAFSVTMLLLHATLLICVLVAIAWVPAPSPQPTPKQGTAQAAPNTTPMPPSSLSKRQSTAKKTTAVKK